MVARSRPKDLPVGVVLPERFGRDHHMALLYIEHCVVDLRGFPVPEHMRVNPSRHPDRVSRLHETMWKPEYSTKLEDGQVVPGHDDWDCINDFVEAGLVELSGTVATPRLRLTDAGWYHAHELRRKKATGGIR